MEPTNVRKLQPAAVTVFPVSPTSRDDHKKESHPIAWAAFNEECVVVRAARLARTAAKGE